MANNNADDLYGDSWAGPRSKPPAAPEPIKTVVESTIPKNINEALKFPSNKPDSKQVQDGNIAGNVLPTTQDFYKGIDGEFNETDGTFSLYDPLNPDRALMDLTEQEVIELSSPPIYLYRLDSDNIITDDLYGETKYTSGRKYLTPIKLFGSYEEPAPIQELIKFGIQEPEEIDIHFNFHYIMRTLNRTVRRGEVIRTYDNKLWEVMTSVVLNEPLWKPIHNLVRIKRLETEGIKLPGIGDISISPNSNYSDVNRKVPIK